MVPVDCTTSMRMTLPFSGTGKDSDRFSCGILLYRLGRTRSTTEPATGEWRRLPCRARSSDGGSHSRGRPHARGWKKLHLGVDPVHAVSNRVKVPPDLSAESACRGHRVSRPQGSTTSHHAIGAGRWEARGWRSAYFSQPIFEPDRSLFSPVPSPPVPRQWAQSANSLGNWRARQDSNLRPSAEKADVLSN